MKRSVLFTVLWIFLISNVYSQTWNQIGSDIYGEEEDDRFGYSISLNGEGSIIAISSDLHDSNSGYVKVFENVGGVWTQMGENIYGNENGYRFGYTISLNLEGTILVVGAPFDGNGYVKIFEYTGGYWTQIGDDIKDETVDNLGYSVCLNSDGTILAVGITGTNGGLARVYKNISGTWTQIGNNIEGEPTGYFFGWDVKISSEGSIVAISSPWDDVNGTDAGHVRVYENISDSWTQIGTDIYGDAAGDYFGWDIDLNSDGSVLAVGAWSNDGNGLDAGHAKIYQNISGTWTQIGEDIEGDIAEDNFGGGISINSDGSVVAIGAQGSDVNGSHSGQLKIYKNIEGSWTQIGDVINGDAMDDYAGRTDINTDGSIVALSAPWNDGNMTDAGQIRVFQSPFASVNNYQGKYVSIYPNPTSGIVNISIEEKRIQKIIITDILGRIISKNPHIQEYMSIDLSDFKKGLYIINIQTDNEIFISKVIKR